MIFFHQRLNNYKKSKLQYMNSNFKTLLVIVPHPRASLWCILTKIDMWPTPTLISKCTPNSNFSANQGNNENDQRIIQLFSIFTTIMRILTIFLFSQCAVFIIAQTHKWATCMEIKGSIIIHVELWRGWKLMILRCFIQILSGFENWDIQDLTLRRYNTIKTCR